ncbi:MAG: hypothetical protein MAGBODY4_00161 [Candidatus Marinimicrobia bacterium]|nr:hypothetical protein [Candidatus Neomarinimicrobiota bacterium]
MLEDLQRWAELKKLRRRFRKEGTEPISFSRAVADVRQILICVPWPYSEFRIARYVLKFLARDDTSHEITFVAPDAYKDSIPKRSQDRIIALNGAARDDLGRFVESVEEKVLDTAYQATADLNTDFDFGVSLLCRKSDAPLRIGFASEYADIFYNIEIQKPENKFLLEGAYRSIQRILALETKS